MNSYKEFGEFSAENQKVIREGMKILTKANWVDDNFIRTYTYLVALGMIVDMRKIKGK